MSSEPVSRETVFADHRRGNPPPRGFTLIEILVALAITLVMMAAVAEIFSVMGRTVNDSRATVEMSGRVRGARNLLQQDLRSTTCPTLPWTRPEAGVGYFEYVEGIRNDDATLNTINGNIDQGGPTSIDATTLAPVAGTSLVNITTLGDFDDILMFTVRSRGEPFIGRGRVVDTGGSWTDGIVESQVAEIIWFAIENPADGTLGEPGMRTLYRRVLLVAPSVVLPSIADNLEYYRKYDISAHVEAGDRVPNTLADLTKRENRFGHASVENAFPPALAAFPHPIDVLVIHPSPNMANGAADLIRPLRPLGAPFNPHDPSDPSDPNRLGEDVVLTNVLAWDVRTFDPGAPLYIYTDPTTGTAVVIAPGDSGYAVTGSGAPPVDFGAYVDLNYYTPIYSAASSDPVNLFMGDIGNGDFFTRWLPTPFDPAFIARYKSQLTVPTYDTWSFHYEHDGIDQDGGGTVDEGTDGFDSDSVDGVDDIGERETSPPYPVPLRGIQVTIRVYEPDSRAVREVTVRQHFVPE